MRVEEVCLLVTVGGTSSLMSRTLWLVPISSDNLTSEVSAYKIMASL